MSSSAACSKFKVFTVSVAKTYVATEAEGWTVVGTYVGKNVRGVQVSPFSYRR